MKNNYLQALMLAFALLVSHITVAQPCSSSNTYPQATTCQGQSYPFNGKNLDTAGTYNDTIVLAGGCDSIISLQLFVIPIVYNHLYDTMCAGSTYTFYGQTLTTPGLYGDTLFTGTYFCDSVILLHLAQRPSLNDTFRLNDTYCMTNAGGGGGMPGGYSFYGQTLRQSGVYVHTASLPSGAACADSVVVLTLRVGGNANGGMATAITVCGASYDFNGRTLTANGQYSDTLQSSIGCDSIISIRLTLNGTYYQPAATTATICTGGSYVWRGTTYTQPSPNGGGGPGGGGAGGYKDTVIAASGCDTIYTLILRQGNNAPTMAIRDSFCAGSTYIYRGSTFTVAGTDTVYLPSTTGCDTSVFLTITYKAAPTFTIVDSFCQGATYTYRGNSYATSGSHLFTVPAPAGCDSIIYVNLSYKAAPTVTVVDSFCHGTSYTYRGNAFTTSGLHALTYAAPSGCDTVINIILTYTTPLARTIADTICQGSSFIYGTDTFTTRGTHTFTVATASQCDSLITLNLATRQAPRAFLRDSFCQGSTYYYGTDSFTTSGQHAVTVPASVGCDTMVTLFLNYRVAPVPPVITQSGSILIANPNVAPFQWYLGGAAIAGATSQTYVATQNGVYSVASGGSPTACQAVSANYTLSNVGIGEVSGSDMFKLYPNPNHGKFTIEVSEYANTEVTVYDVLGRPVYQKQLAAATESIDMSTATNGTYYIVVKGRKGTSYSHFVVAQ